MRRRTKCEMHPTIVGQPFPRPPTHPTGLPTTAAVALVELSKVVRRRPACSWASRWHWRPFSGVGREPPLARPGVEEPGLNSAAALAVKAERAARDAVGAARDRKAIADGNALHVAPLRGA